MNRREAMLSLAAIPAAVVAAKVMSVTPKPLLVESGRIENFRFIGLDMAKPGSEVCVVSRTFIPLLRQEPGFVPVEKYASYEGVSSAEIGRLGTVRYVAHDGSGLTYRECVKLGICA